MIFAFALLLLVQCILGVPIPFDPSTPFNSPSTASLAESDDEPQSLADEAEYLDYFLPTREELLERAQQENPAIEIPILSDIQNDFSMPVFEQRVGGDPELGMEELFNEHDDVWEQLDLVLELMMKGDENAAAALTEGQDVSWSPGTPGI
jgi:hypothetical protein